MNDGAEPSAVVAPDGGAGDGTPNDNGASPAPSGETVVFAGVVKSYPHTERPALAGVDLTVAAGEFAFVVGASGSGKSTLIRLALREELPTSGTISIAGRDLVKMKRRHVPALRRDIGVVFQDFRLLPDQTVAQNVAYVLHVLGEKPDIVARRVPEVLDMVGLSALARRRPHELSGGEQQRVAIARAVAKNPPILLADEPTGNLDPVTSLEILRVLQEINAHGATVIMATHDDDLVDRARGRVVELDAGRVVRDERSGGYVDAARGPEWPTVAGRPGDAPESSSVMTRSELRRLKREGH